jgi:hypothetical protein
MNRIIEVKGLNKEFKSAKREPGLRGYFKTLLSRKSEVKKALNNVDLEVNAGEFLGKGISQFSYLTPIIGIISFIIAYKFWKLGLKNYTSTGS